MRELAILLGDMAASLEDNETGMIIKKEKRNGKMVAVIYHVGENVERITDETNEPVNEKPPLIADMDSQEDKDVMGEPTD